MKVYLVNVSGTYEYCGCIGVFSTEDKAKEYIDTYKRIGINADEYVYYKIDKTEVDYMDFNG